MRKEEPLSYDYHQGHVRRRLRVQQEKDLGSNHN